MKNNKSPESTEVTPSKKKLKQARLPFMPISDVSPKAATPQARKRKLSVPESEPVNKIGKISKENGLADDLVVISDEDSRDASKPQKDDKPLNPYVKLVDAAWKKKQQKGKAPKKAKKPTRKVAKTKKDSSKENVVENDDDNDVEMVEVDVQIHEERSSKENTPNQTETDIKKVESNGMDNDIKTDQVSVDTPSENSTNSSRKTRSRSSITNDSPKTNRTSQATTPKSEKLVQKSPTKTKLKHAPKKLNTEQLEPTASEIISIEDSNNSSDVKMAASETASNITDSKQDTGNQNSEDILPDKDFQNDQKPDNSTPKRTRNKQDTGNQKSEDILPDKDSKNEQKSENSTPKRTRNKTKEETNSNTSIISTASSKLDESMSSLPGTPKHDKSSANLDESMNDSNANISVSNLTPKQLQKRVESAKKKEEREKEKLEREKKRQQEKEERAKQKQEKEELKKREREEKEEAKKREREEKEEQKRKEREEREKQKELLKKEKEQKEEQKRKEREDKEEQRRKEKEAREEERRKRQEALDLEKQEQELKKKKAAEAFVNFFVPKQKIEKEQIGPVSKSSVLSSFTIKGDMRLAPTVRVHLSEEQREVLDKCLEKQGGDGYLKRLKEGAKTLSSGKTWPLSDKDDDVMIVEDELPPIDSTGEVITCDTLPREKLRPKLLSFHENRRPPYWGTWRKKSSCVGPRRPFGQDEKLLDYEVDSDDDWEEEQEGESLDGSVCGSDDENGAADDYEIDNEVFVPHGYLSDEEATMDEEDSDMLSLTPETQKARLKHLEDEFETELKKPTEKLKPRLYGLLWENSNCGKPDNCVDALWNYFGKFSMIMNDTTALLQPANEPDEEKKKVKKKKAVAEGEEQSPKTEKKKKVKSEKEIKKAKPEPKKAVANQPGINSFLTKMKTT